MIFVSKTPMPAQQARTGAGILDGCNGWASIGMRGRFTIAKNGLYLAAAKNVWPTEPHFCVLPRKNMPEAITPNRRKTRNPRLAAAPRLALSCRMANRRHRA